MSYNIDYRMPLVRHMVEQHGGSVELSSTPGKGTTVSLVFPALAGA